MDFTLDQRLVVAKAINELIDPSGSLDLAKIDEDEIRGSRTMWWSYMTTSSTTFPATIAVLCT